MKHEKEKRTARSPLLKQLTYDVITRTEGSDSDKIAIVLLFDMDYFARNIYDLRIHQKLQMKEHAFLNGCIFDLYGDTFLTNIYQPASPLSYAEACLINVVISYNFHSIS